MPDAATAIDEKLRKAKTTGADHPKGNLEIIAFDDMLEPNLKTRARIKGIIDETAIALIYGESGSGKTFFTLDLSLHVGAGQEWFGRRVTKGRVVYVAAEAGRSIKNRVAAWAQKRGGDQEEIDFRAVVSPIDLCHLGKGDDVDRLVAAIGGADVVVIDTVSRALAGGNENAPDDMGGFVMALDRIREKLGCAVIAVHHVGKDASRGGRGHSLLHCAVDTEIEVEHRDGGISVALVTKQRDGPGGAEIAFKLVQIELGNDQDGDPVTSCVVEPSDWVPSAKTKSLSPQDQKALDALNAAVAEKGETIKNREVEIKAVRVSIWREYMEAHGLFSKTEHPNMVWSRARRKLSEGDDPYICFRWAPANKPDHAQSFVWPTRPEALLGLV